MGDMVRRRASLLLSLFLLGCGGEAKPPVWPGSSLPKGDASSGTGVNAMSASAGALYDQALDAFVAHDKASDWNDEAYAAVAKKFDEAAAAQGGKLPPASFNAGLAYQRCNDDKNALARFKGSLEDDPKFHHARAQLALYRSTGQMAAGRPRSSSSSKPSSTRSSQTWARSSASR